MTKNVPVVCEQWYMVSIDILQYDRRTPRPAPISISCIHRSHQGRAAERDIAALFDGTLVNPPDRSHLPLGVSYRSLGTHSRILPEDVAALYEQAYRATGIKTWSGREDDAPPPPEDDRGKLLIFPRHRRPGSAKR